MALTITDANYSEIVATDKLIMIDFWAQWCGPCKSLSSVVDELAQELEGKVIVGKVDVDDNEDIVEKLKVRSIPTLIFIKDGQPVGKCVGALPKSEIINKINELL